MLSLISRIHHPCFRPSVSSGRCLTRVLCANLHGTNVRPQSHQTDRDDSLINLLPVGVQPYARLVRLDKPIGTSLLFIPCTWSIGMAAVHDPTCSLSDMGSLMALFGVGSIVMRGAGCIINDLWDQDIDKKVDRTRGRPLASGAISTRQALIFLASQLSIGLGVLTQLNTYSILLGASSMFLVSIYPLAKRFTSVPQLVLGGTFNWGALLGYPALLGYSDWSVTLPLYLSGVFWTLNYDTIYAHQDKKDDAKIGVKSSALTFGSRSKPLLYGFTLASGGLWMLGGIQNTEFTIPFVSCASLATLIKLEIVRRVDLDSSASCGRAFRASQWSGWLVTLGIVADKFLQSF